MHTICRYFSQKNLPTGDVNTPQMQGDRRMGSGVIFESEADFKVLNPECFLLGETLEKSHKTFCKLSQKMQKKRKIKKKATNK